jgi:transcriptional regulator NrdR family protein
MLRCPRCYERDIHKSKGRSFGERLLWLLILRRPVRCYTCTYRFTTFIFRRIKPRQFGYGQSRSKKAVA